MRASWAANYVGLPFKDQGRERDGVDCWGLIRLIYRERYGLLLPSYAEAYVTAEDEEEIGALVRRERPAWLEIPLAEAAEGDVLVLRMRGQPMHVALALDQPWFLHVHEGINAVVERRDSAKWAHRLVGAYRYGRLALQPRRAIGDEDGQVLDGARAGQAREWPGEVVTDLNVHAVRGALVKEGLPGDVAAEGDRRDEPGVRAVLGDAVGEVGERAAIGVLGGAGHAVGEW